MVSVFYVIAIEAIICGFMLNRTLYSRTKHKWHMPIYVLVKTIVCTCAVYYKMLGLVTPLCVFFSAVYALICFKDSLLRKLSVVLCGVLCLMASNAVKFALLNSFGITQFFKTTPDVLLTIIVLCFSLLFFCLFTIITTNLLCRVRIVIISGITAVHLLLLLLTALLYYYMYNLLPVRFNSLYSVFALFLLLPAVAMLYFSESIVFTRKDNYFIGDS